MNKKKNDDKSLIAIVKNNQAFARSNQALAIKNRDAIRDNRKAIDGNRKAIEKNGKKISSLDTTLTELTALVIENKMEIREIKEIMKTKADKSDINRILDAIDNFAGRTESNEQQIIIGGHQMRRTDKRVDIIETDVKQIKPLVGLR